MNLRSSRPTDETKSKPDAKEPHVFQEPIAVHGSSICVLCSKAKSDPRHISEEEPARWGF